MNKWKISFFIVLFLLILISGFVKINSKRYNDTIEWIYSIPVGTSIDSVKKITPYYVEIDWENPEKDENIFVYYINIKWNYDLLNMSNGLVFENAKFKERYVHK